MLNSLNKFTVTYNFTLAKHTYTHAHNYANEACQYVMTCSTDV